MAPATYRQNIGSGRVIAHKGSANSNPHTAPVAPAPSANIALSIMSLPPTSRYRMRPAFAAAVLTATTTTVQQE